MEGGPQWLCLLEVPMGKRMTLPVTAKPRQAGAGHVPQGCLAASPTVARNHAARRVFM